MKEFFRKPTVIMSIIGIVCFGLVILVSEIYPYLPGAQR